MLGDKERCLETGKDGCVSEPLYPTELFAAVEDAVLIPKANQTG